MRIKIGEVDGRTHGSAAEQRAGRTQEQQQKSGIVGGTEFETAPHDYRRTDEELLREIRDAFSARALLAPESIDVSVEDGIIILDGIVSTEEVRGEAEAIAHTIMDVQGVDNRMQVMSG